MKKQLLGGTTIITMALLMLMVIAWNSAQNSANQFENVRHTYQVINSLNRIQADLNLAEIEQHSYFISGMGIKLKRRNEALARLDSDMGNSAALIKDSFQSANIRWLKKNLGVYEAVLDANVLKYQVQGMDGLRQNLDKSYSIKQDIHKMLADMGKYESHLLDERNQLEARSMWQQHASFVVLLIFAALAIMMLFWRVFLDINERTEFVARLAHQASHDELTGLANRHLFNDRIEQAIVYAKRAKRIVMVMLVDLDRFKLINDSLGHGVGDELLRVIANRLSASVRPGDTVARLGGDEFALVLSDMAAESDAAPIANKLIKRMSELTAIESHSLAVSASIGIALYPRDGETAPTLLKSSDMAMYRAKEAGRNGFQFYTHDMNAHLATRIELETALRCALERQEMMLYYQPKVELQQGRIIGAEALIRWRHPVLGMVSPADFIPLAEETGLILPIGTWVIETACRQIREWLDAGIPVVPVAVNLSARQFQHEKLSELISGILSLNEIDVKYLAIEITESVMMQNPERAAETLNELKRIGIAISMDDFGTGYSSLNYLKRFPIDTVKIDQSFIRSVASDPQDEAIVNAIIILAHILKIDVIAEGVETEEQLNFLCRHDCDAIQGYLFSPAVPHDEFSALLHAGKSLFLGKADALPAIG